MATHSSILAWEIPWTEELGRLQSMRSHRVGHDLATKPPPPMTNDPECLFLSVFPLGKNIEMIEF